MTNTFQATCRRCMRGTRTFFSRYRTFLGEPGTIFTLASGLLLILAIFVNPAGIVSENAALGADRWLYFAAALVGSSYIWWSAVQGIRAGDFTADIPVSLATLAAIAIGQYPAAAVVAVLLLLGGMLEGFVAARAGNALEDLAHLLPDRVTVRKDGVDVVLPVEAVQAGDLVLVRPGERIAVDGEVLSGAASVNQSSITGESILVDKRPGDPVFAGTLNEAGALEIRTTQVGDQTTLGQIRRMVLEAQASKAPIERLLDRYAKFYTPAAILLGLALWAWTGDILRAITVLIVFCPCVMVLATPTALVASIGNAALRGSLVKKGATIEGLAKVTTLVFDKTGTLTTGSPRLVEVISLDGCSSAEILQSTSAAEKYSEHPLGKAVVEAARQASLAVEDPDSFEALPGMGVSAQSRGRTILVGKPQFFVDQNLPLSTEIQEQVAQFSSAGRTIILSAVDGRLSGLLVFEDRLRPEAQPMLQQIQAMGLRTVLLTGDQAKTAARVAAQLGIQEVHAEVLPHQKVEIVRRIQQETLVTPPASRQVVAFIGDGINDGPALAAADVGIAMGLAGTDLAIETAEITLLSDDLSKLPHLIALSRRAMRVIGQNLIFSLSVLALAVGLTVAGILTPVTGALLHELSSIPVIANSARLIGMQK